MRRRAFLLAIAGVAASDLPDSLLAGARPASGGKPIVAFRPAPAAPLPVAARTFDFERGADRPLRTAVWYPDAAGRFPLVLFSHGLKRLPEEYTAILLPWVRAGFVVAAPEYPFTNPNTTAFSSDDIPNQPADASAVITALLATDLGIDAARIGAGGHSAGAFTTVGLLSRESRDPRVRAAVVIAGEPLNGGYVNPPTDVLFVHGDRDPLVPYATGRKLYDTCPWPKAFLTLTGADHDSYVLHEGPQLTLTSDVTLAFLKLALYGADPATGLRAGTYGDGAAIGLSKSSGIGRVETSW